MSVSKNTWNKGLNSDLSKLKPQQDSYLDGKNIRVVTDEGSSTLAIENIRGNVFSFKLPKVNNTYTINFINLTGSVDITISRGLDSETFTIPNVEQKDNEFIANELNTLIQASTILPYNEYVIAYFNSRYLVVYDFLPQSLQSLTQEITLTTTPDCSTLRTNAVDNHTILGWGYYNDNLVLISCNETSNSENPSGEEGFVWDAKYIYLNDTTNSIENIDGDYLNPAYHLKYAGKLNLSRQHAISKHLKCRYESADTVRIVWTDWHNNLRNMNIADPQVWATVEELLSYLPAHLPQKPIVTNIINGGSIPSGKIQYFYKLFTNQGAESSYSPLSNLLILTSAGGTNFGDPGNPPSGSTAIGKSVQITYSGLDTNYDTIRVGYVIYQTPDFPEAFFFDEKPIPDDGVLVLVHNGNENDIPLGSATEIGNLNRPPEIFKTIDVVRNRLFAANAKTKYFDLDGEFDSRVYRYNSSQIANLYNSTDTYGTPSVQIDYTNPIPTITIEGTTYTPATQQEAYQILTQDIPDTFDLINPFNDENPDVSINPLSNGNWIANSQYKYQSDGVTIGGSGPNISYEFTYVTNTAHTGNTYLRGPVTINPRIDTNGNYISELSDGYTYMGGNNNYFQSHKSPVFETLFTGYSRGEVYRFGILFYDIYGYPSYVNWIGDIKFPFANDNNGDFGLTEPTSNTILSGPAFIVIPDPERMPGDWDMFNAFAYNSIEFSFQPSGTIFFTWNPTPSNNDIPGFVAEFNANNTGGLTAYDPGDGSIIIQGANVNQDMQIFADGIPFIVPSQFEHYTFAAPTNDVVLKQLGIKFSLDTSTDQFQAISTKISGWSFVRVRRTLENKTKLGTGYLQPTFAGNIDIPSGVGDYSIMPYVRDYNNDVNAPTSSSSFLFNRWGFDIVTGNGGQLPYERIRLGFQIFNSPNFLLQQVGQFAQDDFIRLIGRTEKKSWRVEYSTQNSSILSPSFINYGNITGGAYVFYVMSGDFTYDYTDTTPLPNVIDNQLTTSDYLNTNPLYQNVFQLNGFKYIGRTFPSNTLQNQPAPFSNIRFFNMATYNVTQYDTQSQDKTFLEWGAETILVAFDGSTSNFPDTSAIFDDSDTAGEPEGGWMLFPFYLASYERYLVKQYGGNTRSARYGNEYISTNHYVPYDLTVTGSVTNSVYGGDTWVNYFDWQRSNPNPTTGFFNYNQGYEPPQTDDNYKPIGVAVYFPAECSFHSELNISTAHASSRSDTTDGTNPITIDNYRFNPAYSQENTTNVFLSKFYLQQNLGEEPHTIYGSNPKLDNELFDSWRNFLINNKLTVNGNYGEINRLVQFKDKLYYYQNDAFGVASVDERVLQNDGELSQTQLGTGTLLQRFDYISTETGAKHSFAVEATGSSIYHYDSFINKLFKYSTTKDKDGTSSTGVSPLTDVKGLSGFFRTAFTNTEIKIKDKTLAAGSRVGITSGYNSEYNTVYFTFFDETKDVQYTIAYNELLDAFESFYDFNPSLYINMRKRFLSVDPLNTSSTYIHNLGLRNTFYNNTYPSQVKFRVNENADFVKTFDNFYINTEVINVATDQQLPETITTYSISNDYQIVNETISNFTQKIRSWRKQIPRDETNPNLNIKPRISDKYIDVLFKHTISGGDKIFRLHDVLTEYSMRSKILPR
jgi:hypothetical protein